MKRFLLLFILGCCPVAGGTAVAQSRGAELRFAETNHDFGDVPQKGGEQTYDFAFTNGGDVPLVITRVVTSCSCIRASYPRRPVAPGGSGTIRIVYEPIKSAPGAFNKVIQIYSNALSKRDVITVQGNSLEGDAPQKIETDGTKVKIR